MFLTEGTERPVFWGKWGIGNKVLTSSYRVSFLNLKSFKNTGKFGELHNWDYYLCP